MKTISITLITFLIVLFSGAVYANPFSDVPSDHWAYEAVKKLAGKEIIVEMPDGMFQGDKIVTRYELAYSIFKTVKKIETGEGLEDESDLKLLEKLVTEFADEIALLGAKVTDLDDDIKSMREEVNEYQASQQAIITGSDKHINKKITITGDSWIHIENVEYELDTVDNNINTYYQIGLNMSADIAENVGFYGRFLNEELVGQEFGENIQGSTFNIDVAYLDIKKIYTFGDVRIGRQFFKVGHSIALDNKLDSITVSKQIDKLKILLVLADMDDVAYDNGFGLKGFDLTYPLGKHTAEAYFITNSTTNQDPVNYGLSLDGNLIDKVDYFFEYGKSDPDTAGAFKSDFWLSGVSWEMSDRFDADIIYAKGDEDYSRVAGDVYYYHRFKDMFGRIYDGDTNTDGFQSLIPEGRTNATGSLAGIKDYLIKLSTDFDARNEGYAIYERVKGNDSNADGVLPPAFKRITLGIDHIYKPNTTFGIRYDTVVFDLLTEANDAGGWYRVMVDMKINF